MSVVVPRTRFPYLRGVAALVAVTAACYNPRGPASDAEPSAAANGGCAGVWELTVETGRPTQLRIQETSVRGEFILGDITGPGTYKFPIKDVRPTSYVAYEPSSRRVIARFSLLGTGDWRQEPPLIRDVRMSRACLP